MLAGTEGANPSLLTSVENELGLLQANPKAIFFLSAMQARAVK